MKLPDAENAIIEEQKLIRYLLNVGHRRGGSKAKFCYRWATKLKNGKCKPTIFGENI